jgi:hypothetical protein
MYEYSRSLPWHFPPHENYKSVGGDLQLESSSTVDWTICWQRLNKIRKIYKKVGELANVWDPPLPWPPLPWIPKQALWKHWEISTQSIQVNLKLATPTLWYIDNLPFLIYTYFNKGCHSRKQQVTSNKPRPSAKYVLISWRFGTTLKE